MAPFLPSTQAQPGEPALEIQPSQGESGLPSDPNGEAMQALLTRLRGVESGLEATALGSEPLLSPMHATDRDGQPETVDAAKKADDEAFRLVFGGARIEWLGEPRYDVAMAAYARGMQRYLEWIAPVKNVRG